jgi:hypothetical protein
MRHQKTLLIAGLALSLIAPLGAQSTGTPSFSAPYRAFKKSEIGAVVSFPNGNGVAFEGVYRRARGSFDLGLRGGMWAPGDSADAIGLLGVEARQRVIKQTEDFPLDGALTLGVGTSFGDNWVVLVPLGLSLGRRVEPKDSSMVIVPYVQPTTWLVFNDAGTDVQFSLGLGVDFRLSRRFDARISAGIGDYNGVSLGAVWLR